MLTRLPSAVLRPFVKLMWATDQTDQQQSIQYKREHVLPTGNMHLVFRFSEQPLRIFDNAEDISGNVIGHSIVGGARAKYYMRDVSKPSSSAGVCLLPGASEILFGISSYELADRHTSLNDLWGKTADSIREQLIELKSPELRLDFLEVLLKTKLPLVRGLHPAIAQALEQFSISTDVSSVVKAGGYSHRQFISLFKRSVGLTPKLYCRILRYQKTLKHIASDPSTTLTDLALDAGYSDQAHFTREFREFTGFTPEHYRKISPIFSHHLPIQNLR